MSGHRIKELVSILMESPFYWTIPIEERFILLKRLMDKYTTLINERKPMRFPERA
jgi:hypothetical protein